MIYFLLTDTFMEVLDQLRQFGLTASESTVYLFLLQNGISSPPTVSQETSIARTNCYNILDTLQEKGLIEERMEGKRKAYLARSPESILQMIEVQRQAAVRLLPDLKALYTTQKNKPTISYYAGWEEIRGVLYQSFEAEQVMALGSMEVIVQKEPALYKFYRDELVKRGIKYQEITTGISGETNIDKDLYQSFQLGSDSALPTAILLWGENAVFITLEDPAFATLIRNKAITDTFYLLFKTLKSKQNVS